MLSKLFILDGKREDFFKVCLDMKSENAFDYLERPGASKTEKERAVD